MNENKKKIKLIKFTPIANSRKQSSVCIKKINNDEINNYASSMDTSSHENSSFQEEIKVVEKTSKIVNSKHFSILNSTKDKKNSARSVKNLNIVSNCNSSIKNSDESQKPVLENKKLELNHKKGNKNKFLKNNSKFQLFKLIERGLVKSDIEKNNSKIDEEFDKEVDNKDKLFYWSKLYSKFMNENNNINIVKMSEINFRVKFTLLDYYDFNIYNKNSYLNNLNGDPNQGINELNRMHVENENRKRIINKSMQNVQKESDGTTPFILDLMQRISNNKVSNKDLEELIEGSEINDKKKINYMDFLNERKLKKKRSKGISFELNSKSPKKPTKVTLLNSHAFSNKEFKKMKTLHLESKKDLNIVVSKFDDVSEKEKNIKKTYKTRNKDLKNSSSFISESTNKNVDIKKSFELNKKTPKNNVQRNTYKRNTISMINQNSFINKFKKKSFFQMECDKIEKYNDKSNRSISSQKKSINDNSSSKSKKSLNIKIDGLKKLNSKKIDSPIMQIKNEETVKKSLRILNNDINSNLKFKVNIGSLTIYDNNKEDSKFILNKNKTSNIFKLSNNLKFDNHNLVKFENSDKKNNQIQFIDDNDKIKNDKNNKNVCNPIGFNWKSNIVKSNSKELKSFISKDTKLITGKKPNMSLINDNKNRKLVKKSKVKSVSTNIHTETSITIDKYNSNFSSSGLGFQISKNNSNQINSNFKSQISINNNDMKNDIWSALKTQQPFQLDLTIFKENAYDRIKNSIVNNYKTNIFSSKHNEKNYLNAKEKFHLKSMKNYNYVINTMNNTNNPNNHNNANINNLNNVNSKVQLNLFQTIPFKNDLEEKNESNLKEIKEKDIQTKKFDKKLKSNPNVDNLENLLSDIKAFEKEINILEGNSGFKNSRFKKYQDLLNIYHLRSMINEFENTNSIYKDLIKKRNKFGKENIEIFKKEIDSLLLTNKVKNINKIVDKTLVLNNMTC